MSTNEPTKKTKPVEQFRLGDVTASIWKRESEGKVFYSASIDRSYKNNDGKWKRTSSFSPEELPLVAQVAGQAQAYIAAQRSA